MSADQREIDAFFAVLRGLDLGVSVLIVKTSKGFQASMKNGAGSYAVDIRDDALDALLVATGVVPVLDMHRREHARRVGGITKQANAIAKLLAEDMELLG